MHNHDWDEVEKYSLICLKKPGARKLFDLAACKFLASQNFHVVEFDVLVGT